MNDTDSLSAQLAVFEGPGGPVPENLPPPWAFPEVLRLRQQMIEAGLIPNLPLPPLPPRSSDEQPK
jgi:hypothetical protein